jgi:hypothetical protein
MEHNFEDPLAILLAQIVMIIPVARLYWLKRSSSQLLLVKLYGIVLGPHYWNVFS